MIRVLQVIGAMDRAGAETMIMNYYRHINRGAVQFDFLVHTDRPCDYDDEIEALGGQIYHIPRFTGLNYSSYRNACHDFFEAHPEIDIVHGHIESSASIHLPEAHKTGKTTVCHAHQSKGPLSPFEIAFRLATARNKHSADYYMACSEQAGIDRFGKNVVESDRFQVLRNAISLEDYTFDPISRQQIRSSLELGDDPVFGHVGRFSEAKNHPFLIEVFAQIKNRLPSAKLLLLGRGENEEKIRKLANDKGLNDAILFLGVRKDVNQVMNAFDAFLFPSLWEGLGVVAIEAQANSLPCLVSTVVPDDVMILPTTEKLPLHDVEAWTNAAIAAATKANRNRTGSNLSIAPSPLLASYDIMRRARELEDSYQSMLNKSH